MKIKRPYRIGIGILTCGIVMLLLIGIQHPPEKLKANKLSTIESVAVNNEKAQELTTSEINYWKNLEFELATEDYPGETPDFVVKIFGTNTDYTAMYNENSGIVFFSFIPEISYGFLNSPSPGGWTKPIYKTQANDKLLELLKLKYRSTNKIKNQKGL